METLTSPCARALSLIVLVVVALVAYATGGCNWSPPTSGSAASSVTFNPLVRWRHEGHDWLLVADGLTDQVMVYNAADGRLVRQLGRSDGITHVASVVQRQDRVWLVHDDGGAEPLQLPQLRLLAQGNH